MRKASVAIVHPQMGRGGSEAIVMWGAEGLKGLYNVSIITTNRVDLAVWNSFYGTAVRTDEVTLRQLPIARVLLGMRSGSAIRGALFQRAIREVACQYDVLISAYNLCDFGVPAIHLLDLSWDEGLRRQFSVPPRGIEGLFHSIAPVRAMYLSLSRALARPSGRNLFSGDDVLLAYSGWLARIIERKERVRCGVLYPPVSGVWADTVLDTGNDDFVCIGRISEEKRLERVFEILRRVRIRGHEATLHLIGGFGANIYAEKIKAQARRLSWVVLEGSVSDERKREVLRSCRYGIHGAEGEGFGIAVAEMLKAGCIPFASAEGGPAEILGHEALLFRGDDDAVEKINAVLSDEPFRRELRTHLHRQAEKFSAENFMSGIRDAVAAFLRRPGSRAENLRAPRGALC